MLAAARVVVLLLMLHSMLRNHSFVCSLRSRPREPASVGRTLRLASIVAVRLLVLPRKHLDHPVAAAAIYPPTILAPDDGADALAAHYAMAGNLLRAGPLLQRPEPQGCIVACANELSPIWAERETRNRCWVSYHVVRALAYRQILFH